MADNILFLNMSLVSSKCLFEVWLFNKDVTDDKIGMIAMCWRIFGALITDDLITGRLMEDGRLMVQMYNRGARSIEV